MLSADFLKTAQLLRQRYPDLEVVVPLVNAKRREQFEKIKAEVAPDLAVHLLDGMAREAMIASDAGSAGLGYGGAGVYAGKMPDGSGVSYEALHFLAGETSGENGVCVFA